MGSKKTSKVWLLPVMLVMTLLFFAHSKIALAQQGPTNLLVNGDFEWWDWDVRSWPYQDGIPEVQVCPGWRAYYIDTAPDGIDPDAWGRPEFRDVKTAEFAYRVHSGFLAQKYFTFGRQHIAGLYQQVGGIAPGTPLRFSVYMQTWGCMAGPDSWSICPTGEKSNNPAPMHTRIGIDPTGGTNPWSPNIVWSPEINAYDVWTLFQVDATAQNGTVTVFTHSHADWFDNVFRINNDVYIDDASLVSLNAIPPTASPATEAPTVAPTTEPTDEPTAEPTAEPTSEPTTEPTNEPTTEPMPTESETPEDTPAPTHTPAPTSTPLPDGTVIHIVQSGDTLLTLAEQHKVPVEQIVELNQLSDSNVLYVGHELIISLPPATPTPTAEPATPTPTVEPPTPTLTSTPEPMLPTATPTEVAPTLTPTNAPSAGGGEDGSGARWVLLGIIGAAVIVLLVLLFTKRLPFLKL